MPTRRALLRALVAYALAIPLAASPAAAQRRVEVYRMKYRSAESLLPVVEAVLAGSGSVAVDSGTNSLVLIGEPGAVADALAVLAVQDRRLRTVVLRYGTERIRNLEADGVEVRWTAEAGDFRIGNVRWPHASGSSVSVQAEAERGRRSDAFSGTLRVTEGETGRIETGETLPFTVRRGWATTTQFVTAATGFEAQARILGDGRVEVDLTPFAGRIARGGRIESTGAATLVTVTPGETTVIGALTRASASEGIDVPTAAGRERTQDDVVLVLRADVE